MGEKMSFSVTDTDAEFIHKIAQRAVKYIRAAGGITSLIECEMDITACHANGCPLRLQELLKADNFNFGHDILGIRNCIDRETGKLVGHFRPRYAG